MPACHAGDRRFESGRVRQFRRFQVSPPVRDPDITRFYRRLTPLVLAALVAACGSNTPPSVSPTALQPTPMLAPATLVPTDQPTELPTQSPGVDPTETPATSPAPSETPALTPAPEAALMPFVPVVNFWDTRTSITVDELRAAERREELWFTDADRGAVEDLLGQDFTRPNSITADDVIDAVKRGAVGLLRATEIHPSVRALAIDGVQLFGNDRIDDVNEWPLLATVETSEPWDQSATWTLVAVGDMMFDRLVIDDLNAAGGDKQHLFNGGTSRVTRLRCCSFFGYQYPDVERTGNRGLVREMLTGAD